MGTKGWALVIFILIHPLLSAEAQAHFTLSDPVVTQNEQQVRISYGFPGSDSSEFFTVSLFITDGDGRLIQARALSGDIGTGVPGGNRREILWDPKTDRIFMNEQLYFQVTASRFSPVQSLPGGQVDLQAGSSVGSGSAPPAINPGSYPIPSSLSYSRGFSRMGIVVQSLLIPGLGLSRITGKPHWLRAVAGYGCLAGAVWFNVKAFNTYEGILDQEGFDAQQEQIQRSIREDHISEGFAYAAAGIWLADLVWTIAGSPGALRKSNGRWKSEVRKGGGNLALQPGLDPFSLHPTLGFTYRF